MSNITLTNEQQLAYDSIGKSKSLFLGGAAGSGKSVIITEKIKNCTNGNIVLCATTNKAASVLTEKLDTGVEVPTLHSVLGLKPIYDGSTKDGDEIMEFIFPTSARNNMGLVGKNLIIDESSMISLELQTYILEMLEQGNIESVTFVGDRYQLPCVKGEFFDYDSVEKTIELQKIKRAGGELLDYYNEIRSLVTKDVAFDLYEKAKIFDTEHEFTEYMKQVDGSKIIITYTNEAAKRYSHLIDSSSFYDSQECNALSQCRYQHLELSKSIGVRTNSPIKIVKLFDNYDQMVRASMREDYEYRLPLRPQKIEISNIFYAKVENEKKESMFISIWNGTNKEKERLYLNKFTRDYRKFQNRIKLKVNPQIWKRFAKTDGYLKNISALRGVVKLSPFDWHSNNLYWNNFNVITQALILRSQLVSTAHRAQGITVDVAGLDLDDLAKSEDRKLAYVALTRASKELVFYRSKGDSDED